MWAKIITIKITKDLNYFSLCALNLFNTRVSQFELNYWNKWTFPRHSNLLRCTCVYIYIAYFFLGAKWLNFLWCVLSTQYNCQKRTLKCLEVSCQGFNLSPQSDFLIASLNSSRCLAFGPSRCFPQMHINSSSYSASVDSLTWALLRQHFSDLW